MSSFIIMFLILLAIIPGIYLRYIPFREFISDGQSQNLKAGYVIILLAEFLFFAILMQIKIIPLTFLTIKLYFCLLWVPFILLNMFIIPGHIPQHVFVLGVQSIYTYLLHTIATLIFSFFIPVNNVPVVILTQVSLYLILFFITFKFIRNYFRSVFHARYADAYYWRQICFLPLLLWLGNFYYAVNNNFAIMQNLPTRIILAISIFIICYCITLDLKWLQERVDLSHHAHIQKMQIDSFQNQAQVLKEAQKALAIQRHDFRHEIRLLYSLVQEGHNDEALQHLEILEQNLEKTKIHAYCNNLLMNAVLSIYVPKARKEEIPVFYDINVPAHLPIDEAGMATILSNLLENALQASLKQPLAERELHLTLTITDTQVKLLIKNRFDQPVPLGTDGLPVTAVAGHGLGMQSLAAFIKKYQAMVLCHQENSWFSTSLILNL